MGHFYFSFLVFSEKNPVCRDRTHVPTCQKVTWLPLSYRGDRPHRRVFLAPGQEEHSARKSEAVVDIATKLYTLDVSVLV